MTYYNERPRFEIGRIIERTFGVVGHNIAPFTVFGLLFYGLPSVVFQLLQSAFTKGTLVWQSAYIAPVIVGFILWMILNVVFQGAVLRGALDDLGGGKADMGVMLQAGLRNAPKLFAIGVLIFLMMAFGLLFFIVPGLIVVVLFAAAAPTAIAEGRGVFDSLGRSIRLTRNNRWAIFGLGVIFVVMAVLVSIVLGVILVLVTMGLGLGELTQVASSIVGAIFGLLEVVVGTVAFAALSHELRTAQEGVGDRAVESVFE